jgi:putative spermidine/putrescine transport system permease protein
VSIAVPLLMILPAALVGVVLVLIPTALAVRTSFAKSNVTGTVDGWTFANYQQIFQTATTTQALVNSVEISLATVCVTLLLAWPAALFAHRARGAVKRLFMLVTLAPLLISVVIRTYALVLLLAPSSPINHLLPFGIRINLMFSRTGVVLGLAYTLLPFMVMPILASLGAMDATVERAASSLGARPRQIMRDITLPLTLPGMIAGCTLVFSLSMTSYVIPLLIGGAGKTTLMSLVSQQVLSLFDWPVGFSLCIVLVLAASLVVGVGQLLSRSVGRWSESA